MISGLFSIILSPESFFHPTNRAARVTDVMKSDFSCYLPVDAEAVARGFYLTGAGIETIAPGDSEYPVNGHPAMYGFKWEDGRVLTSFTLIECLSGAAEVEFKRGKPSKLESGEVLMIPPDVWHRYRPRQETGWRVAWVKVAGHMVTRHVANGILPKEPGMARPGDARTFRRLFDNLLEDARLRSHDNDAGTAFKALALVSLCADGPGRTRSTPIDQSNTGDAQVDEALHYIWNHGHRVLDVRLLAESVGVSRRTLETRFQRARGGTILEEINRARLERAEELLANTRLPVADVVGLSGFGSAEAMRQTFLKHRGIRPTDIRGRQ